MLRKTFLPSLLFLILASACDRPAQKSLILVSREYDHRFIYWPALGDSTVSMVDMYTRTRDSVDYYLSRASGIIISGGPDINPAIYGRESDTALCETPDLRRDTLELRMIRYALKEDIPLLCICRGHQMLNAALGGSLIQDIPTEFGSLIHGGKGSKHEVAVEKGTFLDGILQPDSGQVNSSHHQGVKISAPGFRASAFAPDGIIEAIEPLDTTRHSFVLGVQWHPETMIRESDSPFTLALARRFMEEVHATRR